jgi:formate dehydrogenase major subunit
MGEPVLGEVVGHVVGPARSGRRTVAVPKPGGGGRVPRVKTWLDAWPVYRQLTGSDPLGRGKAARSRATDSVVSRTATADRVAKSVCPYCAVGCAQLVTSPTRVTTVRYRRPFGTEWEDLDLDTAMEMIADRVLESRRKGWQEEDGGRRVNRTMGIASLGGATLDNEENYLMKKLYSALGAVQIENQARI